MIRSRPASVAALLLASITVLACGGDASPVDQETDMSTASIAEVLKAHATELREIPGVAGVAIARRDGEPVVLILAVDDTPAIRQAVPDELGGYRVVLDAGGGPFEARDE